MPGKEHIYNKVAFSCIYYLYYKDFLRTIQNANLSTIFKPYLIDLKELQSTVNKENQKTQVKVLVLDKLLNISGPISSLNVT